MLKKNVIAAMVGLAATVGFSASAQAFSLGGYDGPVTMIVYGVDQGTLYNVSCGGTGQPGCDEAGVALMNATNAVGSEDSWGLFKVMSINKLVNGSAGDALWTAGGNEFLVGTYGGLVDQAVDVSAGGFNNSVITQLAVSSGGFLNLYLVNSLGGYDAAVAAGAAARTVAGSYDIAGVDGVGTLFLSAAFSGTALDIFVNDPMLSQYTYGSEAGFANGYLDITGGAYEDLFRKNTIQDQNPQTNYVDVGFSTQNLQGSNSPTNWTVGYSGNVQTSVIPEPGSIALAGLGLLGLAALRRRKQA